jgi:hypothetical protein
MEKMNYEAPQARDLSGFGASGQGPLYPCTAGLIAQGGSDTCSSGAMPDTCSTGMFFEGPTPCTSGSDVDTSMECITGSTPSYSACLSGGSAT